MTDGAASVAAPIIGPSGEAVASVSVVVPSSVANLQPLLPAVRLTAAAIGRAPGAERVYLDLPVSGSRP